MILVSSKIWYYLKDLGLILMLQGIKYLIKQHWKEKNIISYENWKKSICWTFNGCRNPINKQYMSAKIAQWTNEETHYIKEVATDRHIVINKAHQYKLNNNLCIRTQTYTMS